MKKIFIISVVFLLISCSKDNEPKDPTASTLIFPENNQECNQGVDVSGTTKSSVTFRWVASAHTDSYDLVLKDLSTQITSTNTATTNELILDIEKGRPFSWHVISKSISSEETAQSDIWKFYNAGDSVESHTPFPANLVSPTTGSNFSGISSQTLSWQGSDIDNDITSYDVYFGTVTPPTSLEGNTSSMTMNVTVAAGNTYYWRIITTDSQGNNSESEIFEFRVN